MRTLALLALMLTPAISLCQHAPTSKTPADSLSCIKVRPGFKAELMAAEPLVMDPIAFAWGPGGKFWVVEMGDYPLGVDGKGKPGGRIKYLTKSRSDGPYDTMTVFMTDIGYPTGVFPYGEGVLVTCAPEIFYAPLGKDGKAEKKTVLFTGFNEGNQQHRVNGLSWGVDGWIYGANGDAGGIIRSLKTGRSTDIRGRDFRFKVDTGEFEAVSGQSQFGRCRDDWGNWFGNNNSNPMFHYVLDDRFLSRNPHVPYPDGRVQVPIVPGAAPVYPASKPLPRFNSPAAVNHFTSACSTIIYRDDLFGPDFAGNMFVSEPVHNLVHREIVTPKGVTFTSRRAEDEQTSEFLASSDNWFRPAMIQVGPDGALWIADMYRHVIEHPQWIPADWQKKLDLRAGHDLGRIYRVYPADKRPREIPRLDRSSAKDLMAHLESPSGWTRDTAHQLLVGKLDKGIRDDLAARIQKSSSAQARLHALMILNASNAKDELHQTAMLSDPHPAIRKHGIDACIAYPSDEASTALLRLIDDPDPQCRLHAAYGLGDTPRGIARLAKLLCDERTDKYMLAAGLSSISKANFNDVFAAVGKQPRIADAAFGPLMRVANAYGQPLDAARLFVLQFQASESAPLAVQLIHVANMLDALEKNNMKAADFVRGVGPDDNDLALIQLGRLHAIAVKILDDPMSTAGDRSLAIRLLCRGLSDDRADRARLARLLIPQVADDMQSAAVEQLRGDSDPAVARVLLAPWKGYSPTLRGQVLDVLLSRPTWTVATVDALKAQHIKANEIDAVRRQRFLAHKDPAICEAAKTIFASASTADRGQIVANYEAKLPFAVDLDRGAKLFAKSCAICHKFGEVGQSVGPDIAAVGDKSVSGLLSAILDPNRAVEPRYISYVVSTRNGQTFNGVIAAETSTSITLTGVDGKTRQLSRSEIEELSSSGQSLMPEGLERDLSPQDLADVIAYLRAGKR